MHERGKNALIQRQTGTRVPEWNSGGNVICCWYIEVFRIVWVEASTSGYQSGQGLGFQPRCLLLMQGGLCYRVLGIKTKGEDCVNCPDPMYLTS